jgi:hypothetical protein
MNGKIAGNSVIAYAVVSFAASLSGSLCGGGVLMCNLGAIFLVILGHAVRKGSRRAGAVAIFLCAIDFIAATANVVSAAMHGVVEVGEWTLCTSLVLGAWTLLNMALLAQFRRLHEHMAELRKQLPMAMPDPPSHPFQFSLRSMFVLTILVALACAIGTRPRPTDYASSTTWTSTSKGKRYTWCVTMLCYRSGRPAVGYIWREVGTGPSGLQGRIRVRRTSEHTCFVDVDGIAIQPANEFQLFVNDLHSNPMRLVIPTKDATELFGPNLNMSRIEQFWNEVVEPQRRNSPATSASK